MNEHHMIQLPEKQLEPGEPIPPGPLDGYYRTADAAKLIGMNVNTLRGIRRRLKAQHGECGLQAGRSAYLLSAEDVAAIREDFRKTPGAPCGNAFWKLRVRAVLES